MITRIAQAVAFTIGFRAGYRWRRRRQARQLHPHIHIRKGHAPNVQR